MAAKGLGLDSRLASGVINSGLGLDRLASGVINYA